MVMRLRQYRAICDRCGYKYYNYQLQKEWTGLMVCHGPGTNDCWEARNPQDFIRGRGETPGLPWTRPEPEDTFVQLECTRITRSGFADYGAADCMLAGMTWGATTYVEFLDNYFCDTGSQYANADVANAECATVGMFR